MKKKRNVISVLALILILLAGVRSGFAQEPGSGSETQELASVEGIVDDLIPIQGRLTDASGTPLPNADYSITFRLYDEESDGTGIVLCEDTKTVTATDGLFSALMGNCTAGDINGRQLWLSVEVENDGEMIPRQKIAPVPYAWSLRPGAVISDMTSYVGLNRYTSYMGITSMNGIYARASGALFNYGVHGISEENLGAGVSGTSHSSSGYGGYFDSTGIGLYARGGNDSVDLVLGGEDDTAAGDNGRIRSDPAYPSSDIYLTSNDAVLIELDANDDEEGAFRVQSSGASFFQVEENGRVSIATDATGATTINMGDRYRDNAVVAWAKITGGDPGSIQAEFGISAVNHYNTGCYKIHLDISAAESASLIPMAIAEIDSAPVGAGAIRIVSVNQLERSIFNVYINDGNGNLVDNDFIFMVTAR